jgi:hypothetical protein
MLTTVLEYVPPSRRSAGAPATVQEWLLRQVAVALLGPGGGLVEVVFSTLASTIKWKKKSVTKSGLATI